MKRIYILFIFITVIVSSCKKDDDSLNTVTNARARDALYSLMDDWYLWYKEMPKVTISDYDDPYELIGALRYKPLDRWSFVADYDDFVAQFQGSFVGHGISVALDQQNNARIVMIYNNSPLYPEGVRRGWILKQVNNTDVAPVMISGNYQAYSQLWGPSVAGYTNTFLFQDPDGNFKTIESRKASFQVNSVILYDTLKLKSGKTGYLVFDEFIEPSPDELRAAFSFFKQENVTDLILDLRYNQGGLSDVAVDLASYIGGLSPTTVMGKIFYNDKHEDENDSVYFKTVQYPLDLNRLVVITTRGTASASEVVINCLKPFMDVVCIGDTTNGKPTGMIAWYYPNPNFKFIFAPVAFSMVNSQNQGDFYAGFAPEKYVPDDFTHDWGDRNESCLKEAIYYLENNGVSLKGLYEFRRPLMFEERTRLMNNYFIIDKKSLEK